MPVQRTIEGSNIVLREGPNTVRVERPSSNVIVHRMQGHQSAALAAAISAESDAMIAQQGAAHSFYDGWEHTGHDSAIRAHWQKWSTDRKAQLLSNQLLFRPKNAIANMAASVVNMFLGGTLTIHTTRESFESALRKACGRGALRATL
jgi:hypothetical protein